MGSEDIKYVNARCGHNNVNSLNASRIVGELDALLNEHNELLKFFIPHMHELQSDNHAIVINPDKTPAGEHVLNAPVVDDVAGWRPHIDARNRVSKKNHDITAHLFKQKLKSLMSFITKLHVFGPTRMY